MIAWLYRHTPRAENYNISKQSCQEKVPDVTAPAYSFDIVKKLLANTIV